MKEVYNSVEYRVYSNCSDLFAGYEAAEVVYKEIKDIFAKYKIKSHKEVPYPFGGGPGLEPLLSLLKEAWENKELITFFISLPLRLYKMIKNRYTKRIIDRHSKPSMSIYLNYLYQLDKSKYYDDEFKEYGNVLIDLLFLSRTIQSELKATFPVFDFCINTSVSYKKKSIGWYFKIQDMSDYKFSRLLHIMSRKINETNANRRFFLCKDLYFKEELTKNNKTKNIYHV